MCSSSSFDNSACAGVQELIVWYPGNALDEDERRLVEEHAARCATCANLLRFAADFKEILLEKHSPHPQADALVRFVEDKAALNSPQRSAIESHLAICPACREQANMLEAVERSLSSDEDLQRSRAPARKLIDGTGARRRGILDVLKGGLLRPVPAAIYLVVAVLAVGLHVFRHGGRTNEDARRGVGGTTIRTGSDIVPGVLGGVVILPDEIARVRQPGRERAVGVPVDASSSEFLLIELTSLESPPAEDGLYTVEFVREDSGTLALVAKTKGRDFRDNYTLCFFLKSGSLTPGVYVIRVIDPTGNAVFRSTINAN